MNKSSFKAAITFCIATVVCFAISLVSFSHCVKLFKDSNIKIAELAENSAQNIPAVNSNNDYHFSDNINQDSAEKEFSSADNDTDSQTQSSESADSTQPGKNDVNGQSEAISTDEIVEYFNTAVNKIKPTAKQVTKNYEKRTFHEDKTQIPEAIESTAESMVSTMMGDDTEPIVYATKEEIEANFIVPEQSYSSKLKSEWVKTATREDNGKEYVVHIVIKDQKNPTAGNGVGSVCDVIETHEVANKVSFVEEFSTFYYNCEIVATIDKATGNVTHINYKTPLLLNMKVNLFGTHSGVIAFTFEKDYTITY